MQDQTRQTSKRRGLRKQLCFTPSEHRVPFWSSWSLSEMEICASLARLFIGSICRIDSTSALATTSLSIVVEDHFSCMQVQLEYMEMHAFVHHKCRILWAHKNNRTRVNTFSNSGLGLFRQVDRRRRRWLGDGNCFENGFFNILETTLARYTYTTLPELV